MQLVKQDWSFNQCHLMYRQADRYAQPEPERTGCQHQPRHQGGKGRQEHELFRPGGCGRPGAKVVGYGTGKAKEVPSAIKKGIEAAKKNLRKVNVLETTIRHPVLGRFGSGLVLLKPAPEGTGVIAGGPVRAVIQAVGIPNVLTKSIGSHNAHNVVKATIAALEQLCDKTAIADMRGLPIEKL
jgi:small subunit ribosomal protein S5